MKACLIFLILAPHFSTQQYGSHYENELHTGHQHYADDYQEDYYRRSSRHKKHSRRPRKYDEDSCVCDCRVCDPKPCCRPVCVCEEPEPEPDQNYEPGQAPEQNYGGGTNVVFVPYPFPLVVPGQPLPMPTFPTLQTDSTTPKTTTKTTTRKATKTTTRTTTKTTSKSQDTTKNPRRKETESEEDGNKKPSLRQLLDLLQNNANIRIGISRREPSVRPFKTTTRLPKYGIVPLSDHLLEGLISQVRNVKDLQSYA